MAVERLLLAAADSGIHDQQAVGLLRRQQESRCLHELKRCRGGSHGFPKTAGEVGARCCCWRPCEALLLLREEGEEADFDHGAGRRRRVKSLCEVPGEVQLVDTAVRRLQVQPLLQGLRLILGGGSGGGRLVLLVPNEGL